MDILTKRSRLLWLSATMMLAMVGLTVLASSPKYSPVPVSARSGDIFGPACGIATIDGVVQPVEWGNASTQTFQMVRPGGGDPFTATLYVMNGGYYLYIGITINDDEFSTSGQYLPQGDSLRIDFDNDHSGSLFALGDDVLVINARPPQFDDRFISGGTSASLDTDNGGSLDGAGAASRVGNLNHFEVKHPLCSGDSLDFCLHPTNLVGFRLEYLDAEANGSFGGSQFFPGSGNDSEADIEIGQCINPDWFIYLSLIKK